ncbi:MAG: transaldolase family protein [Planctomycetes bacterium]|nr:transaldolase family protein [Planctomycetota bacterium]
MPDSPTLITPQLNSVIQAGISEELLHGGINPLWARLREVGTEPWLDTGDMEEASRLWAHEFTALTTNNTLLNKEIQKGIYDAWIPEAAAAARADRLDLSEHDLILEIAFALNARHGLRLVERFGAYVSVELHTDLAYDVERSLAYGRRYAALSDKFIVKVPLTPEGLIAARLLEEDGINVNFTLGFSARQNFLVTCIARPSWVNIFLGRLNAYAASEGLGDGAWVGERTHMASQAAVREARETIGASTRQIAASMRSGEQVATLAGTDVYTMPIAVAEGYLASNPQIDSLADQTSKDYQPTWGEGIDPDSEGVNDLWEIDDRFRKTCLELAEVEAESLSADMVLRALDDAGFAAIFPRLEGEELATLVAEGKAPKRETWQSQLSRGKYGLDGLFTLAGLHAFAQDQAALDNRIRQQLA